jgi:serine/threonine protein phosphatase PrpC
MFENIHNQILKRDEMKFREQYDCFLSGTAVTIIVKKDNNIYCANVGNVLAIIFYAERSYSYKFETLELSCNHSSFKAEQTLSSNQPNILKMILNHSNDRNFNNKPSGSPKISSKKIQKQRTYSNSDNPDIKDNQLNSNLHKNFDMNDELRRIYESGGEIRKLAGEEKSRIFVKGKYFPGLINTRSLGDQIGSSIGVTCVPNICKFILQEKVNYYLLMSTDGITNVLKIDKIMGLIENNDICKILSNFSAFGIY